MAYVPDNLQKLAGAGPTARQVWSLRGVDAIATVRGAGFISDAKDRGMRVGDQFLSVCQEQDSAAVEIFLRVVTLPESFGNA